MGRAFVGVVAVLTVLAGSFVTSGGPAEAAAAQAAQASLVAADATVTTG